MARAFAPLLLACVIGCSRPPVGVDGAPSGTPQTGAYEATVSMLSDDCTPSNQPPSPVTARIDSTRAPKLSIDVPSSSGPGPSYSIDEVMLSGTDTLLDVTGCGYHTQRRDAIVAASTNALILDEDRSWVPADAGAASECNGPAPTGACTLHARIRYDLQLACAPPCTLDVPDFKRPAQCNCP